jgi:hypothetical protein
MKNWEPAGKTIQAKTCDLTVLYTSLESFTSSYLQTQGVLKQPWMRTWKKIVSDSKLHGTK